MTILTEYRWRCDYDKCKAVSPVIALGATPLGWVTNEPRLFYNLTNYYEYIAPDKHFCCDNHRQQWEKIKGTTS